MKTLNWAHFALAVTVLSLPAQSFAGPTCSSIFGDKRLQRYSAQRIETEDYTFNFPGLRVSSITDSTLATGATLFLLPPGSTASYDSRGGSVAAVETTLLDEGSYTNNVDGITFSGGSTMGLEVAQGVRHRIFQKNAAQAGNFDFIPSVPGAVVYDYGARIEPKQNKLIYPDKRMGAALYDTAEEGKITVGRAGAGTSASASKITDNPIWGGQGAAFQDIQLGGNLKAKVFAAVVVNAVGEIRMPPNVQIDDEALAELRRVGIPRGVKQNTTLSILVTDLDLDRSQLKRLAVMVHTSMAGMIHPFHSYSDGDILFAVSTHQQKLPEKFFAAYHNEETLQREAARLMSEAILRSVTVANTGKGRRPPGE